MSTRSYASSGSLSHRLHRSLSCALGMLVAAACANSQSLSSARVSSAGGPSIDEVRSQSYDGPRARIAISRFENKTHSGGSHSHGMEDMLATALFQSNRFIVLERRQLGDVIAEQDLAATGRFNRKTTADAGGLEGAELIVTAAITEWDPGSANGKMNLGRVPIPGMKELASVAGNYTEAHLGLDLRIIDAKTGRIVAATSVAGKSRGLSGGVSDWMGGASGGARSPMDSAIREAIQASVDFVASKTPDRFYRF